MSISLCFVFGLKKLVSIFLLWKNAIYLITFQPTAQWAKNCRYDEIGGRREARFPRTPLATLDKLASKKDQEFPGKISLQFAIFPSVFDEKVCLISLKPFDRVSCHKKMDINRQNSSKIALEWAGLAAGCWKRWQIEEFLWWNLCQWIFERTRFCFLDRAVAKEGISVLQQSVNS